MSFKVIGLVLAILGTLGIAAATSITNEDEDREKLWKAAEKSRNEGLPKSAIESLQKIVVSATEDKAYPEAVKAWVQQLNLEGQIQEGDYTVYVVQALRDQLATQPAEMQPILNVILVEQLYTYYMYNQWEIRNRTRTAGQPGDDFRTWDGATLMGECDRLINVTLAEQEQLKQISIETYDELLQKGNMPNKYMPTLYDFIARRAIDFYSLEEQFPRAINAFDLSAGSPIFGTLAEFSAWKPESDDQDSRLLKVISIFQDLLQFHENDDDPSARLDLDLARLRFGHSEAFGPEKDARYKAGLQRFIDEHSDHETSALAYALLAVQIESEGDRKRAHELATQGSSLFPNSVGSNACHNLIQTIEQKSCNFSSERVWQGGKSNIALTYRNIDKVHFRLVKMDIDASLNGNHYQLGYLDYQQQRSLLKKRPVREWVGEPGKIRRLSGTNPHL